MNTPNYDEWSRPLDDDGSFLNQPPISIAKEIKVNARVQKFKGAEKEDQFDIKNRNEFSIPIKTALPVIEEVNKTILINNPTQSETEPSENRTNPPAFLNKESILIPLNVELENNSKLSVLEDAIHTEVASDKIPAEVNSILAKVNSSLSVNIDTPKKVLFNQIGLIPNLQVIDISNVNTLHTVKTVDESAILCFSVNQSKDHGIELENSQKDKSWLIYLDKYTINPFKMQRMKGNECIFLLKNLTRGSNDSMEFTLSDVSEEFVTISIKLAGVWTKLKVPVSTQQITDHCLNFLIPMVHKDGTIDNSSFVSVKYLFDADRTNIIMEPYGKSLVELGLYMRFEKINLSILNDRENFVICQENTENSFLITYIV